jgi:hypothetical protein
MKEIMARESSWADGGVPSHACSPAPRQRTLFEAIEDPLVELETALLECFAGQRLPVEEVWKRHGLNSRFPERNYKEVLRRLEGANRITATPPAVERAANTMGDRVVLEFPPRPLSPTATE